MPNDTPRDLIMPLPRPLPAGALSELSERLDGLHDYLVSQLPADAYVSVSATWPCTSDGGLTTLTLSTIHGDDEDDDA